MFFVFFPEAKQEEEEEECRHLRVISEDQRHFHSPDVSHVKRTCAVQSSPISVHMKVILSTSVLAEVVSEF